MSIQPNQTFLWTFNDISRDRQKQCTFTPNLIESNYDDSKDTEVNNSCIITLKIILTPLIDTLDLKEPDGFFICNSQKHGHIYLKLVLPKTNEIYGSILQEKLLGLTSQQNHPLGVTVNKKHEVEVKQYKTTNNITRRKVSVFEIHYVSKDQLTALENTDTIADIVRSVLFKKSIGVLSRKYQFYSHYK
jgi:hypothetical protein